MRQPRVFIIVEERELVQSPPGHVRADGWRAWHPIAGVAGRDQPFAIAMIVEQLGFEVVERSIPN
jgi:hypothetical protein